MYKDTIVYYPQDTGEILTLDELYKQQTEELENQFPTHWSLNCRDVDEWLATPEIPWGLTKVE